MFTQELDKEIEQILNGKGYHFYKKSGNTFIFSKGKLIIKFCVGCGFIVSGVKDGCQENYDRRTMVYLSRRNAVETITKYVENL